jgi:hypothetical protein
LRKTVTSDSRSGVEWPGPAEHQPLLRHHLAVDGAGFVNSPSAVVKEVR